MRLRFSISFADAGGLPAGREGLASCDSASVAATLAAIVVLPCAAGAAVINFNELPTQALNGATVNGVTFGFTVGGVGSTDATFNTINGPGNTQQITPPNAEGNAAGILTIVFAQAVSHIEFGFALNQTFSATPGVAVSQFGPGNVPAGVTNVNAAVVPGELFASGHYSYTGGPIESISIDFNQTAASRFSFDTLVYDVAAGPGGPGGSGVPLPAAVWAGFALAGAIGARARPPGLELVRTGVARPL